MGWSISLAFLYITGIRNINFVVKLFGNHDTVFTIVAATKKFKDKNIMILFMQLGDFCDDKKSYGNN